VTYLYDADADELRELPDEVLENIASCAAGKIKHCPNCGEKTAFPGSIGYNSEPQCHNCEHTEYVVG